MPEEFELSLAALRVNKNLTQEEMAKEVGVKKGTWQNWETGKTFPNVPEIKKIETFFGVKYENINFYP